MRCNTLANLPAGSFRTMPVEEALVEGPAILVAAHPDDETIGAGGLLGFMRNVLIVHVTDGAPRNFSDGRAAGYGLREDYAAARRQELRNALELAGIGEDRTHTLGFIDQEASFGMPEVARRLTAFFEEWRPRAVLTHPYEGGHPDHDATAFAVHAACALVPAPPAIYEFTSYHVYDSQMEVGLFLRGEEAGEAVVLTDELRKRKALMLESFATQREMLRHFPVDVERFRAAPAYDFTQSPHPGTLFYEQFDWGITGRQWRRLATEAAQILRIPEII